MASTPTATNHRTEADSAREAAKQAAGQAQETAQDLASGAQEKAQEVAGQAQEKAQDAKARAAEQVRGRIDERTTRVGGDVKGAAGDLRKIGDQLRESDKAPLARLADQGADTAERLGGYLEDADADRMLSDIEDMARRNPAAVAIGGLLVGFAASRVLRASSSGRADRLGQQRTTGAARGLPSPGGTSGTAGAMSGATTASTGRPPVTGPGVGAGGLEELGGTGDVPMTPATTAHPTNGRGGGDAS